MKKIFITLIFILTTSMFAYNTPILQKNYILKQNINIDEVMKAKNFKPIFNLYAEFSKLKQKNIWMKISLQNLQDKEIEKTIIFEWVNANLELYYTKNNKIFSYKHLKDDYKRGILNDNFKLLPLENIDIYIKVNDTKPYLIFKYLNIVDTHGFMYFIAKQQSLYNYGFFLGILLFAFLSNTIMFIFFREKSLFFYCLFLISVFWFTTNASYEIMHWFNLSNNYIHIVDNVFLPIYTLLSFSLFTKYFFETRKHKFLNSFINIFIISIFISIFHNILFESKVIFSVFLLPIFAMLGLILIKKYTYPAILYCISSIFLFLPFIYYELILLLEISSNFNLYKVAQASSSVSSILLTFSIYLKLKSLEVQKNIYEKQLLQRSKFTAMGEMIANIAHQWRQPLNNVSTTLANIEISNEIKPLTHKQLQDKIADANVQLKYMSNTINDFLHFFSSKKRIMEFTLISALQSTLILLKSSLKKREINIFIEADESSITGCKNELIQVLTIILTNAQDALVQKENKRKIWVIIKDKTITIKDNAGGINPKIIDKIFDPYFSTKEGKNGTGLGLYTAKVIVEKNLEGVLSVENTNMGASFTIKL